MSGKTEFPVGNVITDIGERYVRNILGFDNETMDILDDISLGNSTIAQTKTILDTEATTLGFDREQGTVVSWMNGTDYAFNTSYKFTATGTIRINATGLHWNATDSVDNTMFALASITETTFASNDNCTITWVITVDGN